MTDHHLSSYDLAKSRKELQKASETDLQNGNDLLQRSLAVCEQRYPDDMTLDVLSFYLVLFRKLKSLLSSPSSAALTDLIHARLDGPLLPDGPVASLLLVCLESSVKPRHARATDCLSALARMVEVLPPRSVGTSCPDGNRLLVPLFQHVCKLELSAKSNLVVINTLIPCVPSEVVPSDLISRVEHQMEFMENGSIRGSVLLKLLMVLYDQTPGDERAKEAAVLDILMPLVNGSLSDNALLNSVRYLFPSLFQARPGLPLRLLDRLQPASNNVILVDSITGRDSMRDHGIPLLPAWITIASLCVARNLLSLADLPTATLDAAMQHANPAVRIDTLKLLVNAQNLLDTTTMGLIRRSMGFAAILADAHSRSELTSVLLAFFVSIKTAQASRSITVEQSRVARDLHAWLIEEYIDGALARALCFPVVRAISALNVLITYLDVFGEDSAVQLRIFSRMRVDALLACQTSNFAEIRLKSRSILECAKIPLPGYESLDTMASRVLLQSSRHNVSHPRKTQAESGRATLSILFERLTRRGQGSEADQAVAVSFIDDLVKLLEKEVSYAETDIAKGILEHPLHGIISALSGVTSCVIIDLDRQDLWVPLFGRIASIVDRIWQVAKRVVSLARNSSAGGAAGPEHEIAKVYEVLGDVDDEDVDGNSDHTNLLSGCWRATMEAADLLAVVTSLPISQHRDKQSIWTYEQVDGMGRTFLIWMHEVRHRGTFSKIAIAFARLIEAVSSLDALKPLCLSWLEVELKVITTETLSTTRRSAALPYSILSLVMFDMDLLDTAINRLVELATADNLASSDTTRVHAFNILKIVLLDARISPHLDRYFEKVVTLALRAFSSENWNVRNVGLILFSSLVHRSLGSSSSQDFFKSRETLAKRKSLLAWNVKYPTIIPFLRAELKEAAKTGTESRHNTLFPILIILRSLRCTTSDDEGLSEGLLADVKPFLSSNEWQARTVAAQALFSLSSPTEASHILAESHDTFEAATSDKNAQHGLLLYWTLLATNAINWSELGASMSSSIVDQIQRVVAMVDPSKTPALIINEVLSLAHSVKVGTKNADLSANNRRIAKMVLDTMSSSSNLGSNLVISTCCRILLEEPNMVHSLLQTGVSKEPVLAAVEAVNGVPEIDRALVFQLLEIATSTEIEPDLLAATLDALSSSRISTTAEAVTISDKRLALLDRSLELAKHSRNVILKESALSASGWTMAHLLGAKGPLRAVSPQHVQNLVSSIEINSRVDKSKPARLSAVRALEPLDQYLYPPVESDRAGVLDPSSLTTIHRVVIRLLQDDDVEIRQRAAELVRRGVRSGTPISLERAIEVEWQWVQSAFRHEILSRQQWLQVTWDLFIDRDGFEHELASLQARNHQAEVLFEVESPNQFRDPLTDSEYGSKLLASIDPSSLDSTETAIWNDKLERLQSLHAQARAVLSTSDQQDKQHEAPFTSPISEAFEARRQLVQRMRIHSIILCRHDDRKGHTKE